jgi:glutamine synthetase
MPEPTHQDPETLSEADRHARGISRLPQSLSEALDTWDADENAQQWFPPALTDAYRRYKRTEVDLTKDLDPHELCRRYTNAF